MSRIRSASTKPEVRLRRELWRRGFRYRINDKRLPGTPDIVLPKYRSVVFIHGCFWHGHSNCRKYTIPKTNTKFWVEKVARNKGRDEDVWRRLEGKGWFVIIIWECELEKKKLDSTIDRVVNDIKTNGDTYQRLMEERKRNRLLRAQENKEHKLRQIQLMAEINQL